jgi:tRNA (cmo5U34)-methyltransferase
MMDVQDISSLFSLGVGEYDRHRRRIIPNFDQFYGTVLQAIPFDPSAAIRIADLGAGTGILSFMLTKCFPQSDLTLIDVTHDMLEEARKKFRNASNVRYEIKDYSCDDLASDYDLIVSAMSIHHLDQDSQYDLYLRVFDRLMPGGAFVNADLVKGPSDSLDRMYSDSWLGFIRKSGLKDSQIERILERMQLDQPSPLFDQISWLNSIGYTDVDCFYKYFNFAVVSGRKPFSTSTHKRVTS